MKKIKPIKPRIGHRIADAIKCLRGERCPIQVAYELPKTEHHNVQTFGRQHVTGRYFDEWAPVDMDKVHREEIAAQLGKDLLQHGVIKITTAPAAPSVYGPMGGTIYRAEIRVVLPNKED